MMNLSLAYSALCYANLGCKIFPLKPKSKEPLTKNGHLAATSDTAQVAKWWSEYPDANIGLACEASSLFVIDLDRHHDKADGVDAFYRLADEYGLLDCPRVKTGGNGLHLYFKKPNVPLKGKLQEGIDIKSPGYVVLPPSIHPNGKPYEWEDSPVDIAVSLKMLPSMPDWLLKLCQKSVVEPQAAATNSNTDYPPTKAVTIQKRCPFIKHWVENAPTLSEPDWYQGIGVLAYTVEADSFIHQHSSRYPGYTQAKTQAKIEHWRKDGHGAASCSSIQAQCGEMLCLSCPYKGHITSPIILGVVPQVSQDDEPPMPFPVEVLPTLFREFAAAAALSIRCAPDYLACSLLACASVLIGKSRQAQINSDWREFCNLWIALVGRPASKKSPAFSIVTKYVDCLQDAALIVYQEAKKVYEAEKAQREEQKKKSKSAMPKQSQPEQPYMEEPVLKRLTTTDVTVEALSVLLSANPFGVAIFNDELSGFFRSMNQYKHGSGADRSHYLSMWSCGRLQVDRKSQKEPIIVKEPFLSMLGGIQPDVLMEVRQDRGTNVHDGMMERYLYTVPETQYIPYTEEVPISEQLKSDIAFCFGRLHELRRVAEEGPVIVPLSDKARQFFRQIENETNALVHTPDFNKAMEAFHLKMLSYLVRLALILHTLKQINGETQVEAIELETIQQAKQLTDYFLNHAQHAYKLLGESGDNRRAKEVASKLRRKNMLIVRPRDMQTMHINGCETAEQAKTLLQRLQDYGHGSWNAQTKRFVLYIE